MLERIKKNKSFIYLMLSLSIIIIIITSKIVAGKELIIDKMAYEIIVEQLRNPAMTIFMKNITKLSDTVYMLIIAGCFSLMFYFKFKRKDIAKIIPCSLIFITFLNQTIKIILQRDRPTGYRLIEITGYSFPSGHAMASMAFYGLLIYVIYKLIKNKSLRNILIIINCLIIFLIGISRVYLGVHYLSDIIAGYSISLIYLLILVKLLRKYKIFP